MNRVVSAQTAQAVALEVATERESIDLDTDLGLDVREDLGRERVGVGSQKLRDDARVLGL
jgi:hypothetical protein